MPNIQVKLRRGTTTQHAGFTGAEGEVTVDTDKDTVIVHDGTTAGGHELRRKDDTIAGSEIDNDAVDTAQIAADAVTSTEIATDAVDTDQIAADAVTTSKIIDDAVTPDKVDSTGNYTVAALGIGGSTFANTAIYPLQAQGGTSFGYLLSDNAGGSSLVLQNVNTNSANLGLTFISDNSTINTTNNRFDLGFRHTSGAFYLAFKDNTAPNTTKKAVALQQDGHFRPDDNGSQDLGVTATRWDNVWSNGTFNGSDRNIKQDIQDLDEAEKRVAVKCKSLIKKYRLKDAVAKKGNDARIHVGVIAQDLQAAFESEGLDPFRYSMIGKDTWWEGTDAEGNHEVKYEATPGYTEVTQMSVRYNELLAFIIAAM